jgi:MFS transporter, putative metabolite:H+ symporter
MNPGFAAVLVAALGYFVDVYDLVLFLVVRVQSLKELGLDPTIDGEKLLSVQMYGMLLGGILWGILGDKRGRLSVLFGSIILYSCANIANSFVQGYSSYLICRFIAGIGLAGELGAGITLVSETLSKETRGYGTTIVATVGVAGAVVAATVGGAFDWRNAYTFGGILGLLLLFLRVSVHESSIFKHIEAQKDKKNHGNILLLFSSSERIKKYIACIFVGLPTWFVVGVLAGFSPEIALTQGVTQPVIAGQSVKYAYIGLVVGDLASGFISQFLKSRKKAILLFIIISGLSWVTHLTRSYNSPNSIYYMFLLLGFGVGFWAVFITTAAEQFGTNLRATVTTTCPNFVRGFTPLFTGLFLYFKDSYSAVTSAYIVGSICLAISLLGIYFLEETFGKDLDYTE